MNTNPYTRKYGPPQMLKSYVCFADILGYSRFAVDALKSASPTEFLQKLRKALSTAYERIRESSKIEFGGEAFYVVKVFTDNIVVGCPIDKRGFGQGEPELARIFRIFTELQVGLAMEGFFLRGGIAYGDHYMDDDIVFGDALLEAVSLNKSGGPPRISLAPSAVEMVRRHLGFYAEPRHAPQYEDLLEDADRAIFLNYLGDAFHAFPESGVFFDLIEGHQKSIINGLEKYKGEPGIRAKYEWAARYHNFVCSDFARRHPIPHDPDFEELYALAAEEAQKLLEYVINIESFVTGPNRITLEPIQMHNSFFLLTQGMIENKGR